MNYTDIFYTVVLSKERSALKPRVVTQKDANEDECIIDDRIDYPNYELDSGYSQRLIASNFSFTLMIEQSMDVMGYLDVLEYEPYDGIFASGMPDWYIRDPRQDAQTYIINATGEVEYTTESKFYQVRQLSEDTNNGNLQVGLNVSEDLTESWTGLIFRDGGVREYVINGKVASDGTWIAGTGIRYVDNLAQNNTLAYYSLDYYKQDNYIQPLMQHIKYEETMGLVFDMIIENELDIDRAKYNVDERHYRIEDIGGIKDIQ